MKRQEEIKLNLDSLCLYKGIFEELSNQQE